MVAILAIESMSERKPEEYQVEIDSLKARVDAYQRNLGKIKSPIPNSSVTDHTHYFDGQHLRIALLGDTHIGSKYERLHHLDTAYRIIDKEGIKQVYHQGDIVDGSINMHPGMAYEQIAHGATEQTNRVIKQYPKLDGVQTFFISGNHCDSFMKDGIEIGPMIADKRSDLVYLGQEEADIKLAPNVKYRMRHGNGGGSYAVSYRMQRYLDSLEPDKIPQLFSQGHLHYAYYMRARSEALQVPCFQAQSLYLKSKGLQPVLGMWIVDLHIKSGRINRVLPELITFQDKADRRVA